MVSQERLCLTSIGCILVVILIIMLGLLVGEKFSYSPIPCKVTNTSSYCVYEDRYEVCYNNVTFQDQDGCYLIQKYLASNINWSINTDYTCIRIKSLHGCDGLLEPNFVSHKYQLYILFTVIIAVILTTYILIVSCIVTEYCECCSCNCKCCNFSIPSCNCNWYKKRKVIREGQLLINCDLNC